MALTSALWIALVTAAGTTAVRALRTRPAVRNMRTRPAVVPVRATLPREDEEWRPHVTSGCGR